MYQPHGIQRRAAPDRRKIMKQWNQTSVEKPVMQSDGKWEDRDYVKEVSL